MKSSSPASLVSVLIILSALLLLVLLRVIPVLAQQADLLSAQERQWLGDLERPLVLAATPANRPLEYLDEHGLYQGMVADYIRVLEKSLALRIRVVEPENMVELLRMARAREIDLIAAFAGNPAAVDHMEVTRPYLVLPTTILVNRSRTDQFLTLADMEDRGMELALPKEYAVIDYVRKYHPGIHIQPVYNYLAALLHVSFDEIDATIISLPQASYFIEDKGITNLRVAGHTDYRIYNRIAVRSDWPMLVSVLQKGLDGISRAEHAAIYNRWIRLDQNYLSLLLRSRRVWTYGGAVVLLVLLTFSGIMLWNRTLRRRVNAATAELKQELRSRQRMHTAIEQAQDGIFMLDPEGTLVYSNPAFLGMLGYDEKDLLGNPIAMLRHSKHDEAFYRQIWDHLRKGKTWSGQGSYRRKDGSELAGDLSISPVLNEQGEVVNIVEVVRDVTEKLKMEARLRQQQKMEELGTLAGGIAHDFNNIVAAILGYTELALAGTQQDSAVQRNLERIRKVAGRAREMVNQILVFSRRREPERRRVELAVVASEVLNLLRSSLPSTIEIRVEALAAGAVKGDPSQVHQLIMNLGTNAGYAMRATGGILSLSLKPLDLDAGQSSVTHPLAPGPYMQLELSDTGQGIDPGVQERIFDPFFTTKPQGEGTGMGLAMVHGIVASMGGEISVRSTPGQGTSFKILLPKLDQAGEAQEQVPATPESPRGQGRILLVDDDNDILAIGTEFLEGLGYQVTATADSREALGLFRSPESFDLVVTDQTMPGLTGERLAEAIHAECPELPIILCTGYSERIRHLNPSQLGIRKILIKPFELADLSLAVRESLEG